MNGSNISGGSGTAIVNFNHNDQAYVFSSLMSGTLAVKQIGSGTTILTADNTYTGGTRVEDGTLVVGTLVVADQPISTALGTGNFFVGGGTLRTTSSTTQIPLQVNIGGNYTQDAGGTLALGIGGTQGEQYDHLMYGKRASLNGTLSVSSLTDSSTGKPFQPVSGDGFVVVENVIPNNKAIKLSLEAASSLR